MSRLKPKRISVSEFKAKSLGLFDQVAKSGETIVVTKHGRPLAKVIPYAPEGESRTPGFLQDTLIEEVDIVSPLGAKLWRAAEPND